MKPRLFIRLVLLCLLAWQSTGVVSAQQQNVRITLADGYEFEVDEVWKQGNEIWYRKGSISRQLDQPVKKMTPLTREAPAKAAPEPVAAKPAVVETAALAIWIYLDGGARMRVDEVTESADGAWFRRGNVQKFLERDHIVRIEREQPVAAAKGNAWRENGWTSGNDRIDHLIKMNASRFGVDPYLVFCVIEQESQFKQFARSPKGAQGLMQLMPGTARRLGVRRPYDPAENIMGGTRYLQELMTMFSGRVDLVLASYNAGEGAVMKYGRNVPPYRETREYVKKIGKRYGIDGRKPQEDDNAPVPQQR
ncbi:MAG TPA: lytic transglycosylase domain-containing protein [Pyrinomonadaceae bacterium]|nr:lytic transglycosylase domain-containing protein [Pyrinomonadaceae bacterium]